MSVSIPTSETLCQEVSRHVKARRLDLDLTQQGLCQQAGVSLSTYRRFERTGQLSLDGLARVAIALGLQDELRQLFAQRIYRTLDDVIHESSPRQRGTRK